MLVDTHCHLSDDKFAPDRAEVVAAARTAGVHHIVVVADSVEAAKRSVAVSAELGLSATAGVHPHVAGSWSAEARSIVLDLLDRDEVVAVGEIGLDYHYDFSPRDRQRKAFEDQLRMAAERNIPAVVHAREADADMADMIRAAGATVVMHSFSAGDSVLEAALDAGHYVSFSGMITFKSWDNRAAVKAVGLDRLLVETDSPYLAPVPHRGKRNEPAFVVEVAKKVGEIRDLSFDDTCEITTKNAITCFGKRISTG